jgi:hypothetical protein
MEVVRNMSFLAIMMLAGFASGAPLPLQMIVNNDSMQCSSFLPGDECSECTPPEGWEILGPYWSVPCPENYTMVIARSRCRGIEVEHCCTEKHSGASGDCRNLIKNDLTGECAFVTNATTATLPDGWQEMPENATSLTWVCPLGYTWATLTATNPTAIAQLWSSKCGFC